jgi:hypothetical protein
VVFAQVVLVVLLVVKFLVQVILVDLLIGQGLAREPVNGTRDKLLLDVFAQLVVELETVLDVERGLLVVLCRGLRRREEVEERLGRDGLFDDTGLLGVCEVIVSM